jgi:hypothetical protein
MAGDSIRAEGDKPSVVAVPLPWSVSTSVANLAVSWREDGQCVVRCDGFFGHHHAAPRYKRITVNFTDCISVTSQVRRDDAEVIGGDQYDWSGVRVPRIKTESELTAWLTVFAADWASTGNCPNPQFYRVERSTWAASFRHSYQHFIIEGTDSYVELLARDFTWATESDLPE